MVLVTSKIGFLLYYASLSLLLHTSLSLSLSLAASSILHRGIGMAQSRDNRQLKRDCAAILESMKVYSHIHLPYDVCMYSQ